MALVGGRGLLQRGISSGAEALCCAAFMSELKLRPPKRLLLNDRHGGF
jgi:hypothetical protein